MEFPRLLSVEPRPDYRIYLSYADGAAGEVDLSADVAHGGVFARLRNADYFAQVHISASDAVAWDDVLDLCPDSLYLELTQQTYAEWKAKQAAHA